MNHVADAYDFLNSFIQVSFAAGGNAAQSVPRKNPNLSPLSLEDPMAVSLLILVKPKLP